MRWANGLASRCVFGVHKYSGSHAHDLIHDALESAAIEVADKSKPLLAEQFESSVNLYGDSILQQVRRELFMGLRHEVGARQLIARLNDVTKGIDANMERLARTEVSHAYNQAKATEQKKLAQEVPGVKKQWWHVGSYPCDVCNKLHGTTRPLDGKWTVGKRQISQPPAHPNCVCTSIAMTSKWAGAVDKLERLYASKKKAA